MSNIHDQFKAGQARGEGVVSSSISLLREAGFVTVVN